MTQPAPILVTGSSRVMGGLVTLRSLAGIQTTQRDPLAIVETMCDSGDIEAALGKGGRHEKLVIG